MATKAQSWLRINGVTIGGDAEQSISADEESAGSVTVASSQTNYEIQWAFTLANAKAYAICADQDCTVKTNSTGAPDETLSLKANQALVWRENDPATMAFLSTNLTKIYVTTTPQTVVKFGHAVDITPA